MIEKRITNDILKYLENNERFCSVIRSLEIENYENENIRYQTFYTFYEDILKIVSNILDEFEESGVEYLPRDLDVCSVCGKRKVRLESSICFRCKK